MVPLFDHNALILAIARSADREAFAKLFDHFAPVTGDAIVLPVTICHVAVPSVEVSTTNDPPVGIAVLLHVIASSESAPTVASTGDV